MSNTNLDAKRVEADFLFEDIIIRTNASIEQYISYILSKINGYLLNSEESLRCEKTTKYYHFNYGKQKIFWFKREQIEQYRKESVTIFERMLIAKLECLGVEINKDNKYYREIWGA